MGEGQLAHAVHVRFREAGWQAAKVRLNGLPFTDDNGRPVTKIASYRGHDTSGSAFEISRCGWFENTQDEGTPEHTAEFQWNFNKAPETRIKLPGDQRWLREVVYLPDIEEADPVSSEKEDSQGIFDPHIHEHATGRFIILRGRGYFSCGSDWFSYEPGSQLLVEKGKPHGFVLDQMAGSTWFISDQDRPIQGKNGADIYRAVGFDIPTRLRVWHANQLQTRQTLSLCRR